MRDGGADDEPAQRNGICGGAVRQRPGQQRQRGAPVRAADRPRGTGDGDASGDHPVFHDHSRGGVPGSAGGVLCQGRRDLCAGHGPAGEDRRHGPAADPPVRLRAGCGYPHHLYRATGLKPENMIQNVEILERRRIASEIEVEDGIPNCKLYPDFESGWSYWNDIREFVKQTGTPIERICCDLDFSVFDE